MCGSPSSGQGTKAKMKESLVVSQHVYLILIEYTLSSEERKSISD